MYYVAEVMGQNTYRLQTLLGNQDPLLTHGANKFHADRLVKVELPIVQTNAVGKVIAYTVNGEDWVRAKVIDVSIDGRIYLQREDDPSFRTWVDLTPNEIQMGDVSRKVTTRTWQRPMRLDSERRDLERGVTYRRDGSATDRTTPAFSVTDDPLRLISMFDANVRAFCQKQLLHHAPP